MSPGLRKTTRKGPGAKDTPKCVYSLKIHFGVSLRCVYPELFADIKITVDLDAMSDEKCAGPGDYERFCGVTAARLATSRYVEWVGSLVFQSRLIHRVPLQ